MDRNEYQRFEKLCFDDFRRMATDDSLSRYEKIGFPNSYRAGKEGAIFADILAKLPGLKNDARIVLDIGPGCSELPFMLIDYCRSKGHTLILVDSSEMLSHLPSDPFMEKFPAYYPHCEELFAAYGAQVDLILAYSVLHYIFAESNVWEFFDRSLELLSHGGEMLIGDVPNVSKRKRFFSSPAGIKFHREFTGARETPEVVFGQLEPQQIDDSVIFALLMRARNQGFDAYVLPQPDNLPMANRREDILIRRP